MTALTKIERIDSSSQDLMISDIDNMHNMAKKLMQSKHYQKIGEEGIFAICMMAKSIGMPQLDAMNGELYYVQGKVGMAYEAMNKYIRLAGHSISIKQLDDKQCTLIGKRKDSGDVAEITYTMEDARRAGKTYDKHPKTMLFARCLSMLKRFLFPDVCTKCYVKEEMDDFKDDHKEPAMIETAVTPMQAKPISSEQVNELKHLLSKCSDDVQGNFSSYLSNKFRISSIEDLPEGEYEKHKGMLMMRSQEYQKKLVEIEMATVSKEESVEDAE